MFILSLLASAACCVPVLNFLFFSWTGTAVCSLCRHPESNKPGALCKPCKQLAGLTLPTLNAMGYVHSVKEGCMISLMLFLCPPFGCKNITSAISVWACHAEVLHYLETAYGVVSDIPEDKEGLAGQNSDLDIAGESSHPGLDPSDPPRPPSRGGSEPPRPPSRGAAEPPRPPSR